MNKRIRWAGILAVAVLADVWWTARALTGCRYAATWSRYARAYRVLMIWKLTGFTWPYPRLQALSSHGR